MHHVGRIDWSFADTPRHRLRDLVRAGPAGARRAGAGRGPHGARGRVRSRRAAGSARHVHSFEEALYVLEGELIFDIDRRVHRLVAGDFALMPIGTCHALAATATGRGPLAVGVHAAAAGPPTRRSRTRSSRKGRPERGGADARPPCRSVGRTRRVRYVGHYDGHAAAGRGARRRRTRRAAGSPPAWTSRSSPTAGSP